MKKTIGKKSLALSVLLALLCTIVFLPACGKKDKDTGPTDGTMDELSAKTIESVLSYLPENAEENHALYVEASSKMEKFYTLEEIALPENITTNTAQPFGLFLYDGKTDSLVPYTTEGVFDENKKTLFFAHGMGRNGRFYNCKGYYENGFNVLCFQWGIFASEDIYSLISDKVWTSDGNHRYRVQDDSWYEGEELHYSVAEIYGAYYYDFLLRHPSYTSKEIIIGGHSYGGMLTTALLSYLTTAFRCRLLDSRYLPDRVLLCDPFFRMSEENVHIRWLGDLVPPSFGSIVALSVEAVAMAKQLGISVALFRSSMIIAAPFEAAFGDFDIGAAKLDEFYSSLLYVYAIANSMLPQEKAHNYGETWPAYTTWEVFDADHPEEYAFSMFNPYHAEYARMGERYDMDYNTTSTVFTDDSLTLQNRENAKLYGFAFCDDNANGVMDERLGRHICGAKVKIAAEDGTVVLDTTTSLNGYFEVNVQPGTYVVEVTAPNGFTCETTRSVVVENNDRFVYSPIAMRKAA